MKKKYSTPQLSEKEYCLNADIQIANGILNSVSAGTDWIGDLGSDDTHDW